MSQSHSPSALDTLLSTLRIDGDTATAHIDAGWMQGRTAYGGISSAVALAATMRLHPTETPLRYAQISFVGPVGGDCTVSTRVLRQSKSSLFVDAGVSSDQGFGTAAVFAFSGERTSHLDHNRLTMPQVPDPEALQPVPEHKVRPPFTRHFDMRPTTGPRFDWKSDAGEYLTWVRFVEEPACHPAVALLALGDALPPAAMALFSEFGPISSMNWTINMLTGTPATDDGWWLLSAKTAYARGGFSVQDMMIWNRAGEPILSGSQGIAIYA
ncbi:thioesterase family protein [Sphingopyxis lindanitolerans]|uniref:Thioesterase family protein n=1 Tax=Sphingopyxis lindanitolerans TaxID=2054227 RepID=A0A2S8B500_9SPHN|nr:thioesterase family protein [Sphingopyxis lindanitolerans]PQM27484.1 thioesterase family protein [Sphingopyxis lindanitolerans]